MTRCRNKCTPCFKKQATTRQTSKTQEIQTHIHCPKKKSRSLEVRSTITRKDVISPKVMVFQLHANIFSYRFIYVAKKQRMRPPVVHMLTWLKWMNKRYRKLKSISASSLVLWKSWSPKWTQAHPALQATKTIYLMIAFICRLLVKGNIIFMP